MIIYRKWYITYIYAIKALLYVKVAQLDKNKQ